MFLSKIVLNQGSAAAQLVLSDSQFAHRAVVSMFQEIKTKHPRQEHGVLHVLKWQNNEPVLFIQSQTEPDPTRLPKELTLHPVSVKEVLYPANLVNGTTVRFEVNACPTRAMKREGKASVRRLLPPEAHADWLVRRFGVMGIDVERVDCGECRVSTGVRGGNTMHHVGATFTGEAVIRDQTLAQELIKTGLASGKAYGWGMIMMSVIQK